jgi:hypothetical protein
MQTMRHQNHSSLHKLLHLHFLLLFICVALSITPFLQVSNATEIFLSPHGNDNSSSLGCPSTSPCLSLTLASSLARAAASNFNDTFKNSTDYPSPFIVSLLPGRYSSSSLLPSQTEFPLGTAVRGLGSAFEIVIELNISSSSPSMLFSPLYNFNSSSSIPSNSSTNSPSFSSSISNLTFTSVYEVGSSFSSPIIQLYGFLNSSTLFLIENLWFSNITNLHTLFSLDVYHSHPSNSSSSSSLSFPSFNFTNIHVNDDRSSATFLAENEGPNIVIASSPFVSVSMSSSVIHDLSEVILAQVSFSSPSILYNPTYVPSILISNSIFSKVNQVLSVASGSIQIRNITGVNITQLASVAPSSFPLALSSSFSYSPSFVTLSIEETTVSNCSSSLFGVAVPFIAFEGKKLSLKDSLFQNYLYSPSQLSFVSVKSASEVKLLNVTFAQISSSSSSSSSTSWAMLSSLLSTNISLSSTTFKDSQGSSLLAQGGLVSIDSSSFFNNIISCRLNPENISETVGCAILQCFQAVFNVDSSSCNFYNNSLLLLDDLSSLEKRKGKRTEKSGRGSSSFISSLPPTLHFDAPLLSCRGCSNSTSLLVLPCSSFPILPSPPPSTSLSSSPSSTPTPSTSKDPSKPPKERHWTWSLFLAVPLGFLSWTWVAYYLRKVFIPSSLPFPSFSSSFFLSSSSLVFLPLFTLTSHFLERL